MNERNSGPTAIEIGLIVALIFIGAFAAATIFFGAH